MIGTSIPMAIFPSADIPGLATTVTVAVALPVVLGCTGDEAEVIVLLSGKVVVVTLKAIVSRVVLVPPVDAVLAVNPLTLAPAEVDMRLSSKILNCCV